MINVVKKNGTKEEFEIEKIHKVVLWAIDGLKDVSLSDIEINAKLNIVDGITTDQIHSIMIDSAANLISIESPDYQYVAGRLLNYRIRKHVWGGKNPPKLIDLIKKNISLGFYTPKILNWYTEEEINKIDEFIVHERDLEYTYASVKGLCDKYLVQNQHTKQIHETPQFRYIIAALTIFHNYPKKTRCNYIKKIYNQFSKFKINLATPQLSGLGGRNNSYASCCLISMIDNKESINATNQAIANATCAGYGIGVNYGRMRAIKSPVKGGTILHPGVIPFLKITEANTKAWQKNGIRGGSGTVNFPVWHYEIESIVQLKNANTGTVDNRVFNLDYVVGMSKLFYQRFLNKENITLFSPSDVPGLYEAFGTPEFDEMYVKYENSKVRKNVVNARDLFSLIAKERLETGRIYIMNIDNANQYGCWNEKVDFTNLCVEINQAIDPLKGINDPESEIGVCVLSAINWLEISSDEDMERVCDIVVRMLDEIIDIQDYFDIAAKNFCQKKRSLGIGVTNMAAFLAKNKLKYSDPEAMKLVDEWMEKQQFYLIKASINLAKEKGVCEKFKSSKYSDGILPVDRFNPNVVDLVGREPSMNWDELRPALKEFGMRHTTLTCEMPCESSSLTQNSTNGMEPVRNLLVYKGSKKSSVPMLVPNIKSCGENYELAFEMPDNMGYLNICCAMQRWMDMAMSTNQYFNPPNYPDNKIPYTQIIKEWIHYYKHGGKCLYYLNTNDGNKHFEEKESGCVNGACSL